MLILNDNLRCELLYVNIYRSDDVVDYNPLIKRNNLMYNLCAHQPRYWVLPHIIYKGKISVDRRHFIGNSCSFNNREKSDQKARACLIFLLNV